MIHHNIEERVERARKRALLKRARIEGFCEEKLEEFTHYCESCEGYWEKVNFDHDVCCNCNEAAGQRQVEAFYG